MQKYQNLLWQVEDGCQKWEKFAPKSRGKLEEIVASSGFYDNYHSKYSSCHSCAGRNLVIQNKTDSDEKTKFLVSKYLNGFWLTENLGNNAFAFSEGQKLYVPPLVFVVGNKDFCSLQTGKEIVFRDEDKQKGVIDYTGLEKFILTQGQNSGVPIYVGDNHNWAFYFWLEALNLGLIQPQSLLVHLDAHQDLKLAKLSKNFVQSDLASVKDETANLQVSNYIYAGKQAGVIGEVLSLVESKDFQKFKEQFQLLKKPEQNIILNVDLDLFAPEVSMISLEEKIEAIGYFAQKCDLITFATSPGFMDQELAIEILKVMLRYW